MAQPHAAADTLIVGLGNPLLGDDGVGWRVVQIVERELQSGAGPPGADPQIDVDFDFVSVGGLGLMERLIGYRRAILVDAMTSGQGPPGTVRCFALDALPDLASGHSASAHDATLPTALAVGRSAGAALPDEVTIVAIESAACVDFSEHLTPPVAGAVPEAVRLVLGALQSTGHRQRTATVSHAAVSRS
jgi:hydrogenase maturation protease